MFLLNDAQVAKYRAEKHLIIPEFDENLMHGTYYYFRLGANYDLWDEKSKEFIPKRLVKATPVLTLPANGYAKIRSLERFIMSERVMAIFGQISDFSKRGLKLFHSPFIDPRFDGHLELGIKNELDDTKEFNFGDKIGKIYFYDISETFPIKDPAKTISGQKYEERKRFDDDTDFPKTPSQQDWE